MVLVDTSVWIEFFKRRQPLALEEYVDLDDVVTCLPVVQEVLQGFRLEPAFRKAREAMLHLPIVESPLGLAVVEEAIVLYRTARKQGFTIRASVDALIAVCALRNDLEILHRDRDYDMLARVSRLRVRAV